MMNIPCPEEDAQKFRTELEEKLTMVNSYFEHNEFLARQTAPSVADLFMYNEFD